MKALILNIGSEVLSGKVVNTNSSYIAKELLNIGVEVEKVIVVGDDEDLINKEINQFKESKIDILITTGGLGPTHDDITKEIIAKNLNLKLELNEDAKKLLDDYFDNKMANCNIKQAFFPKEAIVIENKIGTADGAIIYHEDKYYIMLVGPPFEMIPMVKDQVLPFLKDKVEVEYLSKEFIVMGSGESYYEDLLIPLYNKYPEVMISPYAGIGKVRYLVKANIIDNNSFNNAISEFKELMKDYIISTNNEEIEEVVVNLLKANNYTISFSESCTGGLLASKIINVEGASKIINESFITYSNSSKVKYLNVNEKSIEEFGVVSDQVVREMAEGLYDLSKSNVCVSISGIAGPSGGTKEKPVGLVHYAIKINDRIVVEKKIFKGNRNLVRNRTALWVLYRIFCLLK